MIVYKVALMRTSCELVEVAASSKKEAEESALKNEGIRLFKADDKIEVLGSKPSEDLDE